MAELPSLLPLTLEKYRFGLLFHAGTVETDAHPRAGSGHSYTVEGGTQLSYDFRVRLQLKKREKMNCNEVYKHMLNLKDILCVYLL